MGIQVHIRGTNTIKMLLMVPKDRPTNYRKVVLYTGLNAHTSTVQKSTQGNQADPFGTSSRNTSGPHPLYTNKVTLQDTKYAQTASPLGITGVTRNVKEAMYI